MIGIGFKDKISSRSRDLHDLYQRNLKPYNHIVYVSGNGRPFKPDDLKIMFIDYQINDYRTVIE